MPRKRGYSREFTPAPQGHARYLLDKIPSSLWRKAQAKAKREGLSMRALILRLLRDWLGEASGSRDSSD